MQKGNIHSCFSFSLILALCASGYSTIFVPGIYNCNTLIIHAYNFCWCIYSLSDKLQMTPGVEVKNPVILNQVQILSVSVPKIN